MSPELEQKLYEAFPDLFAERHLPMTQSCMYWGIETGDGWYQIIYDLCTKIKEEDVHFTQIKEKFGLARVYVDNWTDEVSKAINEAEDQSAITCEYCGTQENVSQEGSWIKTLCPFCRGKKNGDLGGQA
jgi:rubrerythrin